MPGTKRSGKVDRRQFLELTATSSLLAGGCTVHPLNPTTPVSKPFDSLVSFVQQAEKSRCNVTVWGIGATELNPIHPETLYNDDLGRLNDTLQKFLPTWTKALGFEYKPYSGTQARWHSFSAALNNQPQSNGVGLYYFCGHGLPPTNDEGWESKFVFYDRIVPWSEVMKEIDACAAFTFNVVLLESCHPGSSGRNADHAGPEMRTAKSVWIPAERYYNAHTLSTVSFNHDGQDLEVSQFIRDKLIALHLHGFSRDHLSLEMIEQVATNEKNEVNYAPRDIHFPKISLPTMKVDVKPDSAGTHLRVMGLDPVLTQLGFQPRIWAQSPIWDGRFKGWIPRYDKNQKYHVVEKEDFEEYQALMTDCGKCVVYLIGVPEGPTLTAFSDVYEDRGSFFPKSSERNDGLKHVTWDQVAKLAYGTIRQS